MRLVATSTLISLAASLVAAFEDSSPFIVLSTTKQLDLKSHYNGEKTLTSNSAIASTINALDKCPADAYILVNQPGLHSSDLETDDEGKGATPYLVELVDNAASIFEVGNLYYSEDTETTARHTLASSIESLCDAEKVTVHAENGAFANYIDTKPRVISLDFAPLSSSKSDRQLDLRHNDDVLRSVIEYLPSPNYVVVYTSSPYGNERRKDDKKVEESEVDDGVVLEAASGNFTTGDSLFENYSYFSPAIFMGLMVTILMTLVLIQGLNWISSMTVSYKAFDKKQQQRK